MRRYIVILTSALFAVVSLTGFIPLDGVHAAALSSGCTAINGTSYGPGTSATVPTGTYNKGEVVTFSAGGAQFNINSAPSLNPLANGVISFSYTTPTAGNFGFYLFTYPVVVGPPLTWTVRCSLSAGGGSVLLNFNDGRCNQEPWQAFAVYPDGKGGYIFYAIYLGVGYYAMHVTEQNLDDNPDTGVSHVIAQAQGVRLWRLAGGLLQGHRIGLDGKDYSFNITCGAMED